MSTQHSRDYARIERAIEYLIEHRREQPSLDDVARVIGLSPFHAQRLFQRWAGVSPKRFLQFLTARDAFALLGADRPVLATAYDLGLSGPGRLHDLVVAAEAVAPGDVQRAGAGLEVTWGIHPTPYGDALFGVTHRGLCHHAFVTDSRDVALADLRARWPAATLRENVAATRAVANDVFATEHGRPPLPLHLRGTNFQLKVWSALLRVPAGRLTTYAEIASAIEQPRAHRAVGAAVGRNPIAFVVPCHRVIRASGVIGDYHWGACRKHAILTHEMLGNGAFAAALAGD